MDEQNEPKASGPGVITVTLVILVIAACVCIAAAAWFYFGGRYKKQLEINRDLKVELKAEIRALEKQKAAAFSAAEELLEIVNEQRKGVRELQILLTKCVRIVDKANQVKIEKAIEENEINKGRIVIEGVVCSYNMITHRIEINVGKEHGVKKGMFFYIFEGTDFVAKVEVVEIGPRLSTCETKCAVAPAREGMRASTPLY